jgi:hypothetical protein
MVINSGLGPGGHRERSRHSEITVEVLAMTSSIGFADAALALSHADSPDSDLCGPFTAWFGGTTASVSTLGDPFGSETVCATDPHTARLDEIQLDFGEGPCWESMGTHRPVLEPDLQRSNNTSWPLARQALHETGLGAVFAFPLVVAGINIGAVDLYAAAATAITDQQQREGTLLAAILARQVLRRAVVVAEQSQQDGTAWDTEFSRREIHQASGMILAQMGVSPDDALLVLRGHAFATGRSVREIAGDVVAGNLDFTAPSI